MATQLAGHCLKRHKHAGSISVQLYGRPSSSRVRVRSALTEQGRQSVRPDPLLAACFGAGTHGPRWRCVTVRAKPMGQDTVAPQAMLKMNAELMMIPPAHAATVSGLEQHMLARDAGLQGAFERPPFAAWGTG